MAKRSARTAASSSAEARAALLASLRISDRCCSSSSLVRHSICFSDERGGRHNRTDRCASFTSTRRFCHNLAVCGRYKLSRRKQIVEEYFDTASGEEDWSPRYNVAPTQPVPVIRQHPQEPVRELSLMRWGLIPSWSKDSSVAARMINARSETAATKPAFRDALKSRRCLIPADGFYEWRRTGKTEVSRSMEGSYSPSQGFGIAGKTPVATG